MFVRKLASYLNSDSAAPVRLAILAGMGVSLSWFAFVQPASLFHISEYPKPHIFFIYDTWSTAHWNFILSFLALGCIYVFAWKTASLNQGKAAWAIVLGASIAFAVVLLFQFPYDAADIFDYIIHGRMTAVYGVNPYLHAPQEFPYDPVYRYVAWKGERSPYGPLWGLLAGLASSLAGNGVAENIVAYKMIPGLFLLGSTLVVALILRRYKPESALAGTLLLGWNPVVLYETWGNGHNDMLMVFWMLVAAWAIYRKHYTLGILALTLGALVKYLPLVLIPAALLLALREIPGLRSRLSFLVRTGLACLGLVVLLYLPFWAGPKVLTVLSRSDLFTASIPAWLYYVFSPFVGKTEAAALVSRAALIIFLLFVVWQTILLWRNPSWERFIQTSFNILAFYLLGTILWFQQWYTLWLIGLAPLLASKQARNLAILFGFAALSKQFLIGPYMFFPVRRVPQPFFEIIFGLGIFGIPWIYTIYIIWRARRASAKQPAMLNPASGNLPQPEALDRH